MHVIYPGGAVGPSSLAAPAEAREEPVVVRAADGSPADVVAVRPNPFQRARGKFLQVMDLYVLIEVDDGLLVVDQHALHERESLA